MDRCGRFAADDSQVRQAPRGGDVRPNPSVEQIVTGKLASAAHLKRKRQLWSEVTDSCQSEPAIRPRGCVGSQAAPVKRVFGVKRVAIKKRAASAHPISASALKRSNPVQTICAPIHSRKLFQNAQPCTRDRSSTGTGQISFSPWRRPAQLWRSWKAASNSFRPC